MSKSKRKKLITDNEVKPPLDLCDHVPGKVEVIRIGNELKVKETCSICGKELIF